MRAGTSPHGLSLSGKHMMPIKSLTGGQLAPRKREVWKNGMLFQTSLRTLTPDPDEHTLVWVGTNPGYLPPKPHPS